MTEIKVYRINSLHDAIVYFNKIIDCEDYVVLDFSNASFSKNHLTLILRLALEVNENENEIIIPEEKRIKNALEDIEFLDISTDKKENIIRYTNIKKETDEDYYEFYSYIVKQLKNKIKNLSPELSNKIMQKIYEQFSNVFRHSDSKFGFFCFGQFYADEKIFYITIIDVGITIRDSVNKYLNTLTKENKPFFELNGEEAIKWALVEKNSTTGLGGFGLSLLKELIIKSKGNLEIYSNNGSYKITGGKESYKPLRNKFKGTIINIGLSTDNDQYFYLKGESNND